MKRQARNEYELSSIFIPMLHEVVDYMVQKIWNENKELIRKEIYDVYNPIKYNRTGEFREAWDTSVESQVSTQKVQGKFFYDPMSMSVGSNDPYSDDFGQHVSAESGEDVREYLAEIIYQGLAGPAFGHGGYGPWSQKRDAWSLLVSKIGKQKINNLFREGANKVGLPIQGHRTGIEVF